MALMSDKPNPRLPFYSGVPQRRRMRVVDRCNYRLRPRHGGLMAGFRCTEPADHAEGRHAIGFNASRSVSNYDEWIWGLPRS